MQAQSTVDGYLVIKKISEGSYGFVYLVNDSAGNPYALKIQKPGAEPEAAKRFENEKWALTELDHKYLPKLINSGKHEGMPYFVMTLAKGISLRKRFQQKLEEGIPISEVHVMEVLKCILSVLRYMEEHNIYHRDIKDDNILTDDSVSNVTVIDLGFCKGSGQPEYPASFWNVGASRYSPPSKLRNPSEAHPTHDVFSVGVLAYQLLTNKFPWSVSKNLDVGHLLDVMSTEPLEPVNNVNPYVSLEVSEYISKLLEIADEKRITLSDALDCAIDIKKKMESRIAAPSIVSGNSIVYPRVIRDPLYGDIRLTDYEWRLMGSREFQRLRRIKQLGTAHLVYPGADHTRFIHSLGTVLQVEKIMRSIEERSGRQFDPVVRLTARTYALIHDIAHIPFGHTLEDELGIFSSHERNVGRNYRILLSDKSEIGNILRANEYGKDVLAMFDTSTTTNDLILIRDLVDGAVGADVLDYIQRDSYFCGLDHSIDTALYRSYVMESPGQKTTRARHLIARLYGTHGVRLDADFAIESVLRERFALFLKVYTHPAKLASGAMLGAALLNAMQGKKAGVNEQQIEEMGDEQLLCILHNSNKQVTKRLISMLQTRQLYKGVYRARIVQSQTPTYDQYSIQKEYINNNGFSSRDGREQKIKEIAREARIPPEDMILYCTSSAPGMKKIEQSVQTMPGQIEVRGQEHWYHRVLENHIRLWMMHVFVNQQMDLASRARVANACQDILRMPNEISKDRKQAVLF